MPKLIEPIVSLRPWNWHMPLPLFFFFLKRSDRAISAENEDMKWSAVTYRGRKLLWVEN